MPNDTPREAADTAGASVLRTAGRFLAQLWTDDVVGQAARMADFFFLSLFPALLFVFALTGLIGGANAFNTVANVLGALMPRSAWAAIAGSIREAVTHSRPNVLSLGLVLLLWSGSSGVATLSTSLNQMFDTIDERSWFVRRAIAIAVMGAGALLLVAATAALLAGLTEANQHGLGVRWSAVRWAIALTACMGANWLSYVFLPNRRPSWRNWENVAGAAAATLLWAAATVTLRWYLSRTEQIANTYGALGAAIVLLLWFYITAMAVLVGGELTAWLGGGMRKRSAPR
jgi:membrane protein